MDCRGDHTIIEQKPDNTNTSNNDVKTTDTGIRGREQETEEFAIGFCGCGER